LLGAKTPFYFVKNKNAGLVKACVLYSTNFGKYYVISKIFRNENTEKEEPHDEAPLLLIVRINILISKKGSEKGSDSVDFYCNVMKFRISIIALNQGSYRLVTCSESLFHLSKNKIICNSKDESTPNKKVVTLMSLFFCWLLTYNQVKA